MINLVLSLLNRTNKIRINKKRRTKVMLVVNAVTSQKAKCYPLMKMQNFLKKNC